MSLPLLTIAVLTYKRPWYALPVIYGLRERLHYAGERRFVLIDGGSSESDVSLYRHALRLNGEAQPRPSRNIADGHNLAAHHGGDVWLTVLDDYELTRHIDLTPDVEMLTDTPQVGMVRLAALAYWSFGLPNVTITAQMIHHKGRHWWALDKARTTSPHVHCMAVNLYHRRFWECYGDIPNSPNDLPGDCELRGAKAFTDKSGVTLAIPMRFGEGEGEPFRHIGYLRSEEYATHGARWGAIDVLDSALLGNVKIA